MYWNLPEHMLILFVLCMYLCDTVNCIDRHYEVDPERVALIWEKDEPGQQEYITYR